MRCLLVGPIFLLLTATAVDVPLVYQSHVITQGISGRIIYAGNAPAQSFTAGAAGLLPQVDVLHYCEAGDIGQLALHI